MVQQIECGLVAVIIPTYNRRELVLQAVQSALAQTYAHLHCIVVDNGSTDGTPERVAAIADKRVTVLRYACPLGASGARNAGIESARGAQWVAFLDSDDIWAPTKLQRQLEALAANPSTEWSATALVNTGPDLRALSASRLGHDPVSSGEGRLVTMHQVLDHCSEIIPTGSSLLVARHLLDRVGGFDPDLPICEDLDFTLRAAAEAPAAYVDLPLVCVRQLDIPRLTDDSALGGTCKAVVLSRHVVGGRAHRMLRHQAAQWEGKKHLVAGRRGAACCSYLKAAWTGHAPGQVAYAVAAVFLPGVAINRLVQAEGRGVQDGRQPVPGGWSAQIEPWLAHYRS